MKTNTIIAGLASAIVTFLLGWLVFGILLMDFYNSHTVHYTGLMKTEPIMWAIVGGNLCWGLMIAYILSLAGITSVSKGFITGFIIFVLAIGAFDLMFYATINLYGIKMLAIDTLINGIMGGVGGAVAAMVLGKK